nr:hypothetical protein [Tanacetum cinerariifolium]
CGLLGYSTRMVLECALMMVVSSVTLLLRHLGKSP